MDIPKTDFDVDPLHPGDTPLEKMLIAANLQALSPIQKRLKRERLAQMYRVLDLQTVQALDWFLGVQYQQQDWDTLKLHDLSEVDAASVLDPQDARHFDRLVMWVNKDHSCAVIAGVIKGISPTYYLVRQLGSIVDFSRLEIAHLQYGVAQGVYTEQLLRNSRRRDGLEATLMIVVLSVVLALMFFVTAFEKLPPYSVAFVCGSTLLMGAVLVLERVTTIRGRRTAAALKPDPIDNTMLTELTAMTSG